MFHVRPFTRENFDEALRSPECLVSTVNRDHHAQYLFDYLRHDDVGAKTIVVEPQYVDRDYLQDFAAFYVSCFYPYNRFCSRVHFFREELSKASFVDIIRGNATPKELQQFRDSYLGFIVVRPLPDAFIGRTQLRTYDSPGGLSPIVRPLISVGTCWLGRPPNFIPRGLQNQRLFEGCSSPAGRTLRATNCRGNYAGDSRCNRGAILRPFDAHRRGIETMSDSATLDAHGC